MAATTMTRTAAIMSSAAKTTNIWTATNDALADSSKIIKKLEGLSEQTKAVVPISIYFSTLAAISVTSAVRKLNYDANLATDPMHRLNAGKTAVRKIFIIHA